LLPPDPAITTRPMFGNLSAFVGGNMFAGLFGVDLFVRVSEEDQAKIKTQGGKPFEPMAGRAMTGYVLVPAGWQKKSTATRDWIVAALAFTKKLPVKAPKTKAAKPKAGAARKPAARQAR
jgi:TfoX/Sxy family transcriptional regulator of competence genes